MARTVNEISRVIYGVLMAPRSRGLMAGVKVQKRKKKQKKTDDTSLDANVSPSFTMLINYLETADAISCCFNVDAAPVK